MMIKHNLLKKPFNAFGTWIFDMDGTLTRSIHNFDEFKRMQNLDINTPILEAIESLPTQKKEKKMAALLKWEKELAFQASPAKGAVPLLRYLHSLDLNIGILTRNTKELAMITLEASGLSEYFHPDNILGRNDALPKPNPAGCLYLLKKWGAPSENALMLGDHAFDLHAGRNAKMTTIYVGSNKGFSSLADFSVDTLERLLS